MLIPPESDPGWVRIISGQKWLNYEHLATKVIMGRLTITYELNPSPETAKRCVAELRMFFERNKDHPKVQADLKKIFSEAVIK